MSNVPKRIFNITRLTAMNFVAKTSRADEVGVGFSSLGVGRFVPSVHLKGLHSLPTIMKEVKCVWEVKDT